MRKILCALASAILIFTFYSCDDDGLDFTLPNRGELIFTEWMYVSDTDSLIIDFSYFKDTSNILCFRLDKYELKDGIAKNIGKDIYNDWSVNEDNKTLNLYYKSSYSTHQNDKKYQFDLSNGKLTIYNFYKNRDIIFYQEKNTYITLDHNLITGDWVSVANRDSTALIFENETMKEYVYQKETGQVINYTQYNRYELWKKIYTWKDKMVETYYITAYSGTSNTNRTIRYLINNNKLIIYQNGNPIIYTKIE